jgi:hypothetical protein
MKKLFEIDENEKKRILEMHEKATKRNYLSEQETPQTTQPPQQSTVATSEGTMINGKRYTIENIKDETSLNQFVNWGISSKDEDSKRNPGSVSRGVAEAAKKLNPQKYGTMEPDEVRQNSETPLGRQAIEDVNKSYEEFDKIAQNYTISELCSKSPGLKSGIQQNILSLAQIRVGRYELNWCGAAEPGSIAKSNRDAAKEKIQQQRLQQNRSKF